ncbi:hypothetical protein F3J20_23540 [Paraburkholderia sp. Cy-641]|uniref:hypothetical protein n=1 Tax=Paraburkholderia sp. Cy-641 TaxID=2608337 RepID=UPI001421160C|nr:hypothetical protein [Paraburkholderia sp. Cy-641]NIF80334.1 hypothetical protein [Paraburkholderia sp. Cy-641]
MPSTPFTLIEGAYALPRLRPLAHLPAPFGRDWSAHPPGEAWRAELELRCVALLRTACLRDRDMFACCEWQPFDRPDVAAPATRATRAAEVARPTIISSASGADALRTFAQEPMRIPLRVRPSRHAKRRASRHWAAIAGGTCMVGGAAMLAWIAMGQHFAPTRMAGALLKPFDMLMASHDVHEVHEVRPEQDYTRNEVAHRQTRDVGEVDAPAPVTVTPATRHAEVVATPSVPPVAASVHKALRRDAPIHPAHSIHSSNVVTRHSGNMPRARKDHRPEQGGPVQMASSHGTPRIALMRAAPVASPRLHTRPVVRTDSLPAQARFSRDEYAAVTMAAATPVYEIAPPPRPAASNDASASNGTEWMTHISQRRVTEIPEQFAK